MNNYQDNQMKGQTARSMPFASMSHEKSKRQSRRLTTDRPGMFVKNGKLLLARTNSLAPGSQASSKINF
jgi:hypothetical protein